MTGPSLTIANFTFFEAVRNRLLVFTIICLICVFALTEFTGELAITETRQFQAAIMGSILRLFAVFIVSLFVITSMVREFNDKGFELLLSLPVKRRSYYLGKLLGFAFLSVVIALMVSLPLVLYTDISQLFVWTISLCCELLIMISVSLLCLFTFGNITISFSIVIAFYVLARSISAIILISESPILQTNTLSQDIISVMVKAVAAVLPDFNIFTRSTWLIYGGADINDLYPVIIQTMIYLLLLASATLFDLYRKNL